jgi:hypothetical protein
MAVPILPLNEMSVEEKIKTMEEVRENLSAVPEAVESPAWHEEQLRVREAQIASSQADFVGWEKAKAEIRRQTS